MAEQASVSGANNSDMAGAGMETGLSDTIYTIRRGTHEPDEQTVSIDGVDAATGMPIQFGSFRNVRNDEGEEVLIAQANVYDAESGELVSGEVQMPSRLTVAKKETLHFIERHQKAIRRVGSVAVVLAASAGMVVKRHKSKSGDI